MKSNEHIIGTTTVEHMSTGNEAPVDLHPGLIDIKITYPSGFTGQRTLVDGNTYKVSQESADLLVSKGIATIVVPEVEAEEEADAKDRLEKTNSKTDKNPSKK